MQPKLKILVASDFHYAGPAERRRVGFEAAVIRNPVMRLIARSYRRFIWLHNPLEHHGMLERVIREVGESMGQPDFTVINGDYSCDSAFIGVADPAAFQSAQECLTRLRRQYAPRFAATIGDHELGKLSLFGQEGGLRLASLNRAVRELELKPFWQVTLGQNVLMGVTSTLVALPVYEREAPDADKPGLREERARHLAEISAGFQAVAPDQRILLFCHDPTALPFLGELAAVREKFPQMGLTIIGHLHTPAVLSLSQCLKGMPTISFLGNTIQRLSTALARARQWAPFKVRLCPSPTGIQLLKDGGYLTLEVDVEAREAITLHHHPLPW